MTPDSAFALASISKTYTAAVVLQLVEEGRLALDQPVAPLLPGYKLDKRITVRMLLDHTSGLPDFFLNPKIDKPLQSAPDAAWTPARSLTYLTAKRAKPGSTWIYANTNYLLLGELVTAVTRRPLATEIRDRLLDPLGLSGTWYQVAEAPRTTTTFGYRTATGSGGGVRATRVGAGGDIMPFRSVITAAGGAGSIAATALDTARWMEAFAGGSVLSPSMQAAMLADAVADAGAARQGPVRAGDPGDDAGRLARPRPFGSLPGLSQRGALPARRGDHDRRADQPGDGGPDPCGHRDAQARDPHPGAAPDTATDRRAHRHVVAHRLSIARDGDRVHLGAGALIVVDELHVEAATTDVDGRRNLVGRPHHKQACCRDTSSPCRTLPAWCGANKWG